MSDPAAPNRMRIVALADSLAMPRRSENNFVRWEHTWPYLLQARLRSAGLDAEVINRGERGRTADTLVRDFHEDIEFKRPDIVVIQVGLVDGAPRIFSRREHGLLNLPPLSFFVRFRNWIIARRAARRPEITAKNPLAKVYTPPREFSEHLRAFHQNLGKLDWSLRIIVLPALYDPEFMEKKSPGFGSNMMLYNRLLQEFCVECGHTLADAKAVISAGGAGSLFGPDG
jgi:hypothetical protein